LTNDERLKNATELLQTEPDVAYRLCMDVLRDDPETAPANVLMGVISCRAGRYGDAIAHFHRAADLNPARAEMWNNLGTVYHEVKRPAKAREYFKRAVAIKEDAMYLSNVGVTYTDEGDYHEALKWINRAKKLGEDKPAIHTAEAFARLSLGQWKEGWAAYETTLGGRFRKQLDFGGAYWDGKKTGTLVVYGEQGIGDEIMFGSIIPDAAKLCDRLIIECDPRLESLYRRSFPDAEVHGTRRLERPWLDDVKVDAQIACGSLPALFRPTPESCPRVPFLTADPERRVMWRALFDSWGKPVIGLTWSGGRFASQLTKRTMGLESLRPLIESTDAIFVALQYEDPSEEIERTGLPVRWFKETMKDRPLDDAAALIAELDEQVGIHTTAHHLAGALGKPSKVFVPQAPMWLYAYGDRIPFYAAQTFFRQKKDERWIDCVRRSL
jgi:hypothetical protein